MKIFQNAIDKKKIDFVPPKFEIILVLYQIEYLSNIAIATLDLSLLLPIQLSIFKLCNTKVVALNFLLNCLLWFCTSRYIDSFLYCSLFSYHSSKYRDSDYCRYFFCLKETAKRKVSLSLLPLRAKKSKKERKGKKQRNYTKMKQRRLRAINFQLEIVKSPRLHRSICKLIIGYHHNYFVFGGHQ